jgi:hypothetical protein
MTGLLGCPVIPTYRVKQYLHLLDGVLIRRLEFSHRIPTEVVGTQYSRDHWMFITLTVTSRQAR